MDVEVKENIGGDGPIIKEEQEAPEESDEVPEIIPQHIFNLPELLKRQRNVKLIFHVGQELKEMDPKETVKILELCDVFNKTEYNGTAHLKIDKIIKNKQRNKLQELHLSLPTTDPQIFGLFIEELKGTANKDNRTLLELYRLGNLGKIFGVPIVLPEGYKDNLEKAVKENPSFALSVLPELIQFDEKDLVELALQCVKRNTAPEMFHGQEWMNLDSKSLKKILDFGLDAEDWEIFDGVWEWTLHYIREKRKFGNYEVELDISSEWIAEVQGRLGLKLPQINLADERWEQSAYKKHISSYLEYKKTVKQERSDDTQMETVPPQEDNSMDGSSAVDSSGLEDAVNVQSENATMLQNLPATPPSTENETETQKSKSAQRKKSKSAQRKKSKPAQRERFIRMVKNKKPAKAHKMDQGVTISATRAAPGGNNFSADHVNKEVVVSYYKRRVILTHFSTTSADDLEPRGATRSAPSTFYDKHSQKSRKVGIKKRIVYKANVPDSRKNTTSDSSDTETD